MSIGRSPNGRFSCQGSLNAVFLVLIGMLAACETESRKKILGRVSKGRRINPLDGWRFPQAVLAVNADANVQITYAIDGGASP